ncbi:unnamed protein product [Pipistrellus nathusii]|uniref:Testis expressed 53 n=1 Tax=Pipistrellus nathusii TaxID=59473 RepID=A0ABN9Z7Z4_PIPNA
MGSKFFCCCCPASDEPPSTVYPYDAGTSQQYHPRTFDLSSGPHRNSEQRRCPHPNNKKMKACTAARP